jgi:hypothetical protein
MQNPTLMQKQKSQMPAHLFKREKFLFDRFFWLTLKEDEKFLNHHTFTIFDNSIR